ncbi:ERAD-associated protein [Gryganskiella cystojenkinii]|nr:ERAD-associated protein [Gryganskiella cystojenkinii]
MARKNIRRRVLLGCTVFVAVALFVSANEQPDQTIFSPGHSEAASVEVEKFQDSPTENTRDKLEKGTRLYEEAVQLLATSSVTVHQRAFIPQQSSIVRTLLSDELQKQKGVLPTALRLVTQGFMSFFSSTASSSATSSSTKSSEETQDSSTASTKASNNKRHRDPHVEKAMEMLLRAGYDYGNDDALWTLANIHFHGQYKAKRDLHQAFDMYAALADRSGNATAQQMVGFMYSTGLGNVVERDEAKAVLYTTFAAFGNSTAAELTMGYKHMLGIGTAKSCLDSVFYYKRAADKAYAMYMSGPPLGRTMPPIVVRLTDSDGGTYGAGASGPGAPQSVALASDIKDFIEFHRYIAVGDSPQARAAQFQLGILFYTGNAGSTTIPRDFVKAGKYLRSVADSFFTAKVTDKKSILEARKLHPKEAEDVGITAAWLGKMYWRGEGFEVDEAQALLWFTRGAILNNAVALNGLGMMHLKGAAGLKPDSAQAAEFFKKAADLHYPDAQVNMGLLYSQDPKTYSAALTYFREAAKHHNFQAIYHLGEMHFYGYGVPAKQCGEALRNFKYVAERGDWDDTLFSDAYDAYQAGDVEYAAISYLQAAERGFEVGQSNFAWILDRELPSSHYLTTLTSPSKTALAAMEESALVSLGMPSKLLEMALVYWTRSANQGDVDARVKMGDYYFHGIGTEVDFTKATVCYRVAGDQEFSAMAMWNLGWMHENGVGVPKDFHLAKRWYDKSLSTNPGAVLPVSLSLAKLNARYIWSYLTGGETGENAGSFWSINGKTPSGSKAQSAGDDPLDLDESIISGPVETKQDVGGSGDASSNGGRSSNNWDIDGISESGIEKWKNQKQAGPGEDGELEQEDDIYQQRPPRPHGEDGNEEPLLLEEDDLLEGLVIIGLCMVVGYLMYVRQFRFGPNAAGGGNNNNNNNNNQQQQHQQQQGGPNNHQGGPAVDGLPGDPNAPGRFAYYAAGG